VKNAFWPAMLSCSLWLACGGDDESSNPATGAHSAGGSAGSGALGGGGSGNAGGTAGAPGSGIIDASRRVDWTNAGVPGGIPDRTTICATLDPGASAADINDAIANCPAGGVVMLNAGSYDLTDGIDFDGHDDVTLRGAGANQTLLNFTGSGSCRGMGADICIGAAGNSYYVETPAHTADWTAGFAKGSTVLTLSDTTGLAAGMMMAIDQDNDPADTAGPFVCEETGVCSDEGPGGGEQPNRSQEQYVKVVSVNGNDVSIDPGVYMPNWRASQNPHAWWGNPDGFSTGMGVEDLSVDNSNNASGNRSDLYVIWCYGCWVKGVRDLNSDRNHVWLYQSAHSTVRDSYFYGTKNAASQSYGVESYMGSDNLVENNIFQHIAGPLMAGGACSGMVEAYNYAFDDYYNVSATWMQGSNYQHAAGIDHVLHEGNEGPGFTADVVHGTHNFLTAFRNYFVGWDIGKTAQTVPINLYSFTRYGNMVGNVLGKPGYHDHYESSPPAFDAADTSIYRLGDPGNLPAALTDTLVVSTLLRWGNYDVVNDAARWEPSEVPSALAEFANAVPADQTLPASLYLPGKPGWWPAAVPFPPIGPDVTGAPGPGGHAYANPAHVCYDATPKDGNGVLQFDRASCY
jgi:hypothetical protein